MSSRGRRIAGLLLLAGWVLFGLAGPSSSVTAQETAEPERGDFYYHAVIDGAINPVSRDYLTRVIQQAEEDRARGLILELNTPGGLMDSMNEMTERVLNADVPVIVWVPRGGDATSAGAFLLLSSHVASMASASTVGSATPVQMGGSPPGQDQEADDSGSDRMTKVKEWSVTKIRELATQRDRNPDLPEEFVREGTSVGAQEALEEGIIEFRADTIAELVAGLDGRTVDVASGETVELIDTPDVRSLAWTWQEDFLKTLTNPQLLTILLSLGFMALVYEIANPGVGIGAVLGGIFLLLGFFGLGMMPLNYAGLALMLLGMFLMILDIFVPTFGVLTLGGTVSFVLGGVMLFETELFAIPLGLLIGVAGAMAAFALLMMYLVSQTFMRDGVEIGDDSLVGRTGTVKEDLDPEGMVYVWGEYWQATSEDGSVLRRGTPVEVTEKHERSLSVREHKPNNKSEQPSSNKTNEE